MGNGGWALGPISAANVMLSGRTGRSLWEHYRLGPWPLLTLASVSPSTPIREPPVRVLGAFVSIVSGGYLRQRALRRAPATESVCAGRRGGGGGGGRLATAWQRLWAIPGCCQGPGGMSCRAVWDAASVAGGGGPWPVRPAKGPRGRGRGRARESRENEPTSAQVPGG